MKPNLPSYFFIETLVLLERIGGLCLVKKWINKIILGAALLLSIDQTMDSRVSTQPKTQQKQIGYEEKKAAVDEEMNRMKRLPVNSTYATHRLRVLNKILQLMSIQRTAAQEAELELLFAGLSLCEPLPVKNDSLGLVSSWGLSKVVRMPDLGSSIPGRKKKKTCCIPCKQFTEGGAYLAR
ncbi:hypothetical protein FH972_020508 [Carpinus fangiana]|uniref:Uncharacterized protein n=1 Tax=Carpinus fangiana TaxID=176857 RepID=A0A5N6RXU5_9ROSI|nr:hypothetical protein FH972_020508 [Carpinus fangiana]